MSMMLFLLKTCQESSSLKTHSNVNILQYRYWNFYLTNKWSQYHLFLNDENPHTRPRGSLDSIILPSFEKINSISMITSRPTKLIKACISTFILLHDIHSSQRETMTIFETQWQKLLPQPGSGSAIILERKPTVNPAVWCITFKWLVWLQSTY